VNVSIKLAMVGMLLAACALVLIVVSGRTTLIPEEDAIGPRPILPEPSRRFFPTINIAPAKGWPKDSKPTPAPGLSTGMLLPDQYRKGVFVGEHGSWNRIPKSGYKVIFVPFAGGHPSRPPMDILTGFLSKGGGAFGRPAGVAMDRTGAFAGRRRRW
jgi:glucose/arabinose dehydrogenase